ncbi:MAG TPA: TonB family protein [Rhodocyclaceae bacterium]|nr:TonB family protein [Rhodocyclaceae bacterium]
MMTPALPHDWPWQPAPALPRTLRLALAASIGAHALALLGHYGLLPNPTERPAPLQVELRLPPPSVAPAPDPVRAVTPPLPLPEIRPTPVRTVAAEPRPDPVLTRPTRAAAPDTPVIVQAPTPPVPSSAPVSAPAEASPRPAPVVAVTTPAEAAPAPHVDEAPDPALLERYGRSLSGLLARQQNYPRLAALRGWEGEVQLRVTIARKGTIVATQVLRSSGFEVLDQNAIALVTAAAPLPRVPDALQGREFQIVVPVQYRLDKQS